MENASKPGSFGMMSDAYFLGKRILLDWLNDFLELDVQKVEHCASGAIYCQLLDALYPDAVNMKKVNWAIKENFEYLKNWKIVQEVFKRNGVQKRIPVDRLICARFQDNLEFLQWFYQFFQEAWDHREYRPVERRAKSSSGATASFGGKRGGLKSKKYSSNTRKTRSNRPPPSKPMNSNRNTRSNSSSNMSRSSSLKRPTKLSSTSDGMDADFQKELQVSRQKARQLQKQISQSKKEYGELEKIAKEIETERDFYYGKVLEIDNLIKSSGKEEDPLLQQIVKILYATEDDKMDEDDFMKEMAEGSLNEESDVMIGRSI